MTRARIISIVVIIISLVAIVWSLGGGMFSSRGFEFSIEGAMIEGEVPDTTAWGVAELKLDTAEGRFEIRGKALRPIVVELGSEEVTYCSTLFIERGEIAVEAGCATGTAANDARTAMRAEVDSLAWSCPEGEYSATFERGYDSLARAYIKANRANLYGGWLAERLSRELPIEPARELFEGLSSGVKRTEAVAPLRERVVRYERSQVGCRVENLPEEVMRELQAGRYVLIDFWASWNHDSQVRARELAAMTDRFGDADLTICRISMDNSREQWLSAIEGDPTAWIQLNSEVCELAIESLPVSYLLSPQGKIVVCAESVDRLSKALEELF
ncbi:MAG: hypothetical protein II231_01395 [Rikenellaceae bacterium]|nr:hypothetical protein [Rikenellaceae bacterium]